MSSSYPFRIGLANDTVSRLEKYYPEEMKVFLKKICLSRERSGQPGLAYSGKQLEKILRKLDLLERLLGESADQHVARSLVKYLHVLEKLYKCVVKKHLDPSYKSVFSEFRRQFDTLFYSGLMNFTPKTHFVYDHYEFIMDHTQQSLHLADCSGLEATHSRLSKADKIHSTVISQEIGERIHIEKSLQLITFYNSKNCGFLPAQNIEMPVGQETGQNDNLCVFCLKDMTHQNRRMLKCSHIACRDCFENQMQSSMSENMLDNGLNCQDIHEFFYNMAPDVECCKCHQITTLDEVLEEQLTTPSTPSTPDDNNNGIQRVHASYCKLHNERLELFCDTCNSMICESCLTSDIHQTHVLKATSDVASNVKENIKKSLSLISLKKQGFGRSRKIIENKISEFSTQKNKLNGQILELKHNIIEIIEKKFSELCKDLSEKTSSKLEILESYKEFLDTSQQEADECVGILNGILFSEESEMIIEKKDELNTEVRKIIQLKPTDSNRNTMEFIKLDLSFRGIEGQSILSNLKEDVGKTVNQLKIESQETTTFLPPSNSLVVSSQIHPQEDQNAVETLNTEIDQAAESQLTGGGKFLISHLG